MPKRHRKRTASKSRAVVVRSAAAKPIIIRQSAPLAKRHHSRARYVAGKVGSALLSSERLGAIIGGFALGVLDAKGTKLPTIPVLGRAGTVGVGLYYLGRHMKQPMVSHAATGFLAIAAYEMGKSGTISGDAVVGIDGVDTV